MLHSVPPNFCRNRVHFEISMEVNVPNVPRCIDCVPKYFVLKSLYYGGVARFRASPQLYAIGPHRLQYLFVEHQLVMRRQGRSSSHKPVHVFVF